MVFLAAFLWGCSPGQADEQTAEEQKQAVACLLYTSQQWYNELTATQKNERTGELIMEIIQVKKDKKKYLDLLLLADEQEDMVDLSLIHISIIIII